MKITPSFPFAMLVLLAACAKVPLSINQEPKPQPTPTTITGQVIKGYVQGATVFIDTNGNGAPDTGETVVETDSEGRYTLPAGQTGPIVAIGGVDTVTNVPLEGNVFRAPPGSTVVTPFTTLVTELAESGVSAGEAESRIRTAFGVTLPEGSSLLTFNPIGSTAGAAVEDKAEAVMNTMSAIRSILEGAGIADAAGRAVQAMTEIARTSTQTVSLGDTAVVTNVLQTALSSSDLDTTSAQDVGRVAQAIASVNTQLLVTTGTSEEAVSATRYAQSQLQDLMTQVGETAAGEGESIDLTRLEDGAAETITRIVESPADVVSQSKATSIAAGQRLEDHAFDFALRPAVVLLNGQAAPVQSVSVRFDVDGIELKKTAGTSDVAVETIAPGANGAWLLAYDDLDKIRVVPPPHFNGRIQLSVAVTYAGVGTRPAEQLHVDVAPVNDAPVASGGIAATLGRALSGTAGTLVALSFSDPSDARQNTGGSAPNTLAGIAIVANAATSAQGTWQYSADDGQTWVNLPTVSANAAVLIAAKDRIRFQPAAGFAGAQPGALTAHLVDSSNGAVASGSTVSVTERGGTSRYSSESVVVSAGAVVSLSIPATPGGVGSAINAATLASGVSLTVSLASAGGWIGDLLELRLDGAVFDPPLSKRLTAEDLVRGSVTFTIPASSFGADGGKSVSAVLAYSDSGVVLTSSPLALLIDTVAPAAPGLTLTAASDTGTSPSDRVTSDSSAALKIALPVTGLVAGDRARLLFGASMLAEVTLTATDVQTGFVNVRVNALADGVHTFTAQLADAAGNDSAVSPKTNVAIDTIAPPAVALAVMSTAVTIDANDARNYVIGGDGAEVGSTVELRVIRIPAAPAIYRATPDLLGHFAVQVDAGAGETGLVAISARAVDAAGNASAAVDGQLTVQAAGTPATLNGLPQTDELVMGASGPDVFVAGAGPRQDYFIGAGAFDIVRVSGSQADYVLSFVPPAQRAVHQSLLGSGAALEADVPFVRLAGRGASSGEVVFFQAEAVEFADGTVRITSQDVVSSASAPALNGGAGNDRLYAANSGQRLSSGAGADVLVGGTGSDTIVSAGRSGATAGRTLIGGDGDDTFRIGGDSGSSGSRVLAHGGAGRDRFRIEPAEGFDVDIVIGDMRPGTDRIDLSALRVRMGTAQRALTIMDIDLPALSAALASSSRAAEIDLSAFVTPDGTPIHGTLRIELSVYGAPTLEPADFILAGT